MIDLSAIEAMERAGVPAGQILAVVKEALLAQRVKARDKKRLQRERGPVSPGHRGQRGTAGDAPEPVEVRAAGDPQPLVSGDLVSADSHSKVTYIEKKEETLSLGSEERKKESTGDTRARAKPGCRLPLDFALTPERRTFALTLLPETRIQIEFDRFRDHWASSSGRNAVKRCWDSAWRNWCRNAVQFNGGFHGRLDGRRNDKSVVAAADRIIDQCGGPAAAASYVPGSAGPKPLRVDRNGSQAALRLLPQG